MGVMINLGFFCYNSPISDAYNIVLPLVDLVLMQTFLSEENLKSLSLSYIPLLFLYYVQSCYNIVIFIPQQIQLSA